MIPYRLKADGKPVCALLVRQVLGEHARISTARSVNSGKLSACWVCWRRNSSSCGVLVSTQDGLAGGHATHGMEHFGLDDQRLWPWPARKPWINGCHARRA